MPSLDATSSSSAWRGKVPGVAADEQDMAQTGGLLLGLDADGIETLIVEGELWEVACDDED